MYMYLYFTSCPFYDIVYTQYSIYIGVYLLPIIHVAPPNMCEVNGIQCIYTCCSLSTIVLAVFETTSINI